MGVLSNEVNYDVLLSDLGECCLQLSNCGEKCAERKCIIGYAKDCLTNCLKNDVTYVMDGCINIPLSDSKVFDEESLADSIVNILKQCKSCNEDHFENCIINVMRSCYEVCLFGEIQKYKGSAFTYLNEIQHENANIAKLICEKYSIKKASI